MPFYVIIIMNPQQDNVVATVGEPLDFDSKDGAERDTAAQVERF